MRNVPLFAFIVAAATGGGPAAALDCAKATTPIENAICADPGAAEEDEAMGKAYDALAARLAAPEREALLISQRRWLKRRADVCASRDGEARAACLTDETERRAAYLAGEPVSGPGAAEALAPVLIQHVGKPNQYDLDVDALKFAAPQLAGETLFNAKIDALLKQVPAIDQTDVRENMVYSYDLDVGARFASPALISAHVAIYDFSGGAHGNSSTSNFAIDLEAGKELTFDDLFHEGAQKPLTAECLAQIARQKHEKSPDAPFAVVSADEQRKTIESSVRDLSRWSLFATGARIEFDPYALGAYVEGSYSCDFTAAQLRPLLKIDYLAEKAR